ncbi:ribosomal protein L7AE family protein [Niallia circulans]|uniref:YlxQ family RNA-binding protein n=1 Tax=Shouchella clausii TaxID=79880 RepID=UPI000B95F833|nr:YlxQ family RNA-binding protein [Shouchella clausii]SPU22228.1 ribosomal protein L7AE family protein [Niallia circulans]AST97551.1 50S ribosomal protein L7 [Shouchella clausii]MCM3546987.1 YlxQ family RNA-binding protein [Shouchella clausii]MCR1286239.1 YlxQ family RNA-binding protein [Shouchella clausii]MEB5472577.1 YlxQ family RNA-binding protein [Shouchella clausii]
MSNDKKLLSLLGLCQRAGQLVTGEELVLAAIRKQELSMVILAGDASSNTEKKIKDKCGYYKIPVYQTSDRFALGQAIGKETRVAIGVRSEGFAKKIAALLSQ